MRVTRITLAIVAAAGALGAGALRAQETRTIWDGVYTEAQAKRGEAIYFERCVRCHGPALMGGTDGAGPLTGPTFNGNWNGVPLGQMLDRVRTTMPLDKPPAGRRRPDLHLQREQSPGRQGGAAAPGRDAEHDSVQGQQDPLTP